MGNNPNESRYELLMKSGMPNLITMRDMTIEERISLGKDLVSKARTRAFQEFKQSAEKQCHAKVNHYKDCQSRNKVFWI